MRTIDVMKSVMFSAGLSMVCSLLCLGSVAFAGSVKIGWRETGGIEVPSGTETQVDPIMLGDHAEFVKTGPGELVVPLSRINQSVPSTISVLDGSLKLSPGADSTVDATTPPNVMQKAAYWVAADSSNLVTDEAGVKKWCDVRETNTTSPTFPYAKPAWLDYASATRTVDKGVPPQKVTKDGRIAIYFGGSGSGQHMNWCTRAGTDASISGVYHFFVVHGVYDCWGAVLGDKSSAGFFIDASVVPTYETVVSKSAHFFGAGIRGDLEKEFSVARWYLNGKWIDPWQTPPLRGFQLLSGDNRAANVQFGAFYNQRNATGQIRQGGDYLSEAIVFTNILTEAEKLDVERYLMKKWNLPGEAVSGSYDFGYTPQSRIVVEVAQGATVELATSSGEEVDASVSGEGTLLKSGSGTAVIKAAHVSGNPFDGTLSLAGGKISVKGGGIPALVAESGDRLISVTAIDQKGTMDVTNWQQTARIELTRVSDAGVGRVVKTGNGAARVNAIGEDVDCLSVEEGTLILTVPKVGDCLLPTNRIARNATVFNSSFEEAPDEDIVSRGTDVTIKRARIQLKSEPYYGWADFASGVCSYIFSMTNGVWTGREAWETWINSKLPPTDGVKALYIKQNGAPYTEVDFPTDGNYELSFDATGRFAGNWSSNQYRNEIGIYLGVNATDALNHRVGTIVETGLNPWNRRYFQLENVTKGRKVLMFKSLNTGIDGGTAIDNLKIRYMVHRDHVVTFKIPNGDFEVYGIASSVDIPHVFSPDVPCQNWEFSSSSAWTGGSLNGPVGVVSSATRDSGSRNNYLHLGCDKVFGSTHLAFRSFPVKSSTDEAQNGFGTATTSFTAPGGTFRLRARLANAPMDWDNVTTGQADNGTTAVPSIRAVITRSDGSSVSLGTISNAGHVFLTETWPTDIALTEGETVTLSLSQPFAMATALLDDLELVNVSTLADEVLSNGGFEDGTIGYESSSWMKYTDNSVYTYGTAELNDYIGRSSDYGYNFYEGKRNLNIGQMAGVYQDVTFPRAGLYRLCFAIHSRPDNSQGHNPMRFWIHSANDVTLTNEIVRVIEHSTNFVEHAYFFKVPTPGAYRFGVSGCGVDPTKVTENRRMIMDGFSIRPVAEGAYADAPTVPAATKIVVAANARLVLDYQGTIKCSLFKIAGRNMHGLVTAADDPEHLSGPGSVEVDPTGLIIIVR